MRKDIYLSLYNEYKSISLIEVVINGITMLLKYQMKWLEKLILLYLQKSKLENIILNSTNKKSFHLSKKGVPNESIKKSDDNQNNAE